MPLIRSPFFTALTFLNVSLLGLLTAFGVWLYDVMPARIPTHFGLMGAPDRYADKSWEFFLLLLLPWFYNGLFYLIGHVSAKYPRFLNISNKERFLALSSAEREPVFVVVRTIFALFSLGLNLLFLGLISGLSEVVLDAFPALALWLIVPAVGVLIITAIVGTLSLMRVLDRVTGDN